MKRNKRKKPSFRLVSAVLLIILIFTYKFYIRDIYIDKFINKEQTKTYQGLINLWDSPTRSVIGSSYGFINNAIYNFEEESELLQIELRELSFEGAKTLANEKAQSENHPDIISKYIENTITKTDNIMYDKEFVNYMKETYGIKKIKEEEERCIFPLYGSFNVIIINKTAFEEMGINLPSKDWSYNTFINLIREIKERDTKKEKIPFDMFVDEDNFSYINFILDNGYENIGYKKLETLKKELKGYNCLKYKKSEEDVHYDLYNSKTMIYAGNMDDVNYLIRTKDKENAFEFEVYPYPYETKKVNFMQNVKSYYLLNTKDESKERVIKNFMEYLYQNEGENILNIQGKIPMFKVNYNAQKLKYPYLKDYINLEEYYSTEDEQFILKQKDIYKEVKNILK
ncbi:extracellular solute-binding protein [Anaerofustis sp. NSJ-163]|uniref:extracellular solute-binding protein n=1 Tax=Anaerofustis sp. NSJ-163 TaxID=2944391 RepID=UPI00209C5724|nr:extracellular solute-binding protein [Anaerofustis sp. NSJ-163]MCO8192980.1 extracellular solute-binding protein [Anaerofustis sp. NSJ-163]